MLALTVRRVYKTCHTLSIPSGCMMLYICFIVKRWFSQNTHSNVLTFVETTAHAKPGYALRLDYALGQAPKQGVVKESIFFKLHCSHMKSSS